MFCDIYVLLYLYTLKLNNFYWCYCESNDPIILSIMFSTQGLCCNRFNKKTIKDIRSLGALPFKAYIPNGDPSNIWCENS